MANNNHTEVAEEAIVVVNSKTSEVAIREVAEVEEAIKETNLTTKEAEVNIVLIHLRHRNRIMADNSNRTTFKATEES